MERSLESIPGQDRSPEDQVDMGKINENQGRVEGTLSGDPDVDRTIEKGGENTAEGGDNLSDFEKKKLEEEYVEVCRKILKNQSLSDGDKEILEKIGATEKETTERLEKEYEEICKKINKNQTLPENERENLSEKEEGMLKDIGVIVMDIIEEDEKFTIWRNKDKEDKEVDIKDKNDRFKENLEFKKGEKEIEEAKEEVAEKRVKIEKAVNESIEKYEDMEDRFKKLLSQDEACNMLKEEDKKDLEEILGSLSAVFKNEIDLSKLEYIETELNNPEKLLRDHSYRLEKIEGLEKAIDFFENGLERLGEEEGDLLEEFLEFLKDHPELLKVAALIALAAGFAFLAEPVADSIAATGIMIKVATALKSTALIGSLFAAYALTDEKQRDKFMAWITGTGKVPDWAWLGLDKYGEEKK
ncbi:MAG: hypothetical protein U9P70_04460 [Patescibacteria group bacterium]|nr:hypothetical protein [Patescibacteria group bacterium]